MEIDEWVGGYKVRAFPWVDGKSIYFSVSYYAPGQALSKPPVWEKLAYITNNEAGRRAVYEFTHSVTNYIAGLKIPQGGHVIMTFNGTKAEMHPST